MQAGRSMDASGAAIPVVGWKPPGDRLYMYLQPVVRCKNPDCPLPSAARIRLPYPNPPATPANPPDWPQDGWQLRLICRECDHWYVYEKQDVQWAAFSSPLADYSGLDFQCVELECGEPGCKSRTRWHVLDNSQMSERELFEFVLRADPVVVCENGHPLSISGSASKSTQKVSSV
jgi:hypothetical protein